MFLFFKESRFWSFYDFFRNVPSSQLCSITYSAKKPDRKFLLAFWLKRIYRKKWHSLVNNIVKKKKVTNVLQRTRQWQTSSSKTLPRTCGKMTRSLRDSMNFIIIKQWHMLYTESRSPSHNSDSDRRDDDTSLEILTVWSVKVCNKCV